MAADTPQDMSLEKQKLVRALVKALDPIAAQLRRVPLDDEKQACRELTEILDAVRAIANAVTPWAGGKSLTKVIFLWLIGTWRTSNYLPTYTEPENGSTHGSFAVQNRIDENAINAVALCKSGLTSFTLN
jgi:hypothetical protein